MEHRQQPPLTRRGTVVRPLLTAVEPSGGHKFLSLAARLHLGKAADVVLIVAHPLLGIALLTGERIRMKGKKLRIRALGLV